MQSVRSGRKWGNQMRKRGVIRSLAAAFLLMGLWVGPAVVAAGEGSSDGTVTALSEAKDISVNDAVMDALTSGSEEGQRLYRFTLANAGKLELEFLNPRQKDSQAYWNVALINASREVLADFIIHGDTEQTNSCILGVDAGTYYLEVASSQAKKASTDDSYLFQIRYEESQYWEKERNEDYQTATSLTLNQAYFGTTSRGYGEGEKDYYTFTTTENGYVEVEFITDIQKTSSDYWNVYLYNADKGEGLIGSKAVRGDSTRTYLATAGIPAGNYYVMVQSAAYQAFYDGFSDDRYSIAVHFTASSSWEKEPNGSYGSATQIALDKVCFGTTWSGYRREADYYQFEITKTANYKISMTNSLLAMDGNAWLLKLYNSDGKELESLQIPGNEISHYVERLLSPGTYFLVIRSPSYENANSDSAYQILVSEGQPETEYSIVYANYGMTAGNPVSYKASDLPITLVNPVRDGYAFSGWIREGQSSPETDVTIPEGTTGNLVFTATWTQRVSAKTYSITYYLNGGTAVNPQAYLEGSDEFSLNAPVLSGYTFIGWTGSNGVLPQLSVTVSKGTTGNLTYFANWKKNPPQTYTILYDLGGGKVTGNPASYTTETAAFVLKNPSRTGYAFLGWTGSNGTVPQKTVRIETGTRGHLSFVANWTAKRAISGARIQAASSVKYTCKKRCPGVEVFYGWEALVKGTDYEVTYKNNKNPGTAQIVVKGKGIYTGSVKKQFKITLPKVKIKKVTGKTNSVVLQWSKASIASGYELLVSQNKSFKDAKLYRFDNKNLVRVTVKKLTKGKTYYFKVRACYKISGKTKKSAYSAVKSKKIK